MRFSNIVCLDDILRDAWLPAKLFFYDLIREPIRQATGCNIATSPIGGGNHNLNNSFSKAEFVSLCLNDKQAWQNCYFKIPKAAEQYIVAQIPANSLVLSYEMPPWLAKCLSNAGILYIDIRISPLRFARDLYVALKTNDEDIFTSIKKKSVTDDEIRLEASLVKASVRHLLRYDIRNPQNKCSLVYIGQTADDASLVGPSGNFLSARDYANQIRDYSAGKRMCYKPHPSAGSLAASEIKVLSDIVGYHVELCTDDIYSLLASDKDIDLIGISSGTLQEAPWFEKKSLILYCPICPLACSENENKINYWQVYFENIVSPQFWHQLLAPELSPPSISSLPCIQPNHLRNLHNVWWGYSAYLTKGRHFCREVFEYGGGQELRILIDQLDNNRCKKYIKSIINKVSNLLFNMYRIGSK